MSSQGDDIQLVAFRLAGQDFAFNIFQVERILRYEEPAPLPKAPDYLEGMLRYNDAAVPVIDLRKRLGVAAPREEGTRTIVLEWEGSKLGAVVDAVTEILHIPAASVAPPPPLVRGLAAEYSTGIVVREGRTIVIFNTGKLLTAQEKLVREAAVA